MDWIIHLPTDWPTNELADWLTDILTDSLSHPLVDRSIKLLSDWLTDWPCSWLATFLTDWLIDLLRIDWLIYEPIDLLANWLFNWPTDRSTSSFAGGLTLWVTHWLTTWRMIDWVGDSLAKCLIFTDRLFNSLADWRLPNWLVQWPADSLEAPKHTNCKFEIFASKRWETFKWNQDVIIR